MLAPVITSLFLINYVKKSRNLLKVRCGWWWVVGGWWVVVVKRHFRDPSPHPTIAGSVQIVGSVRIVGGGDQYISTSLHSSSDWGLSRIYLDLLSH